MFVKKGNLLTYTPLNHNDRMEKSSVSFNLIQALFHVPLNQITFFCQEIFWVSLTQIQQTDKFIVPQTFYFVTHNDKKELYFNEFSLKDFSFYRMDK